MAASSPGNNIYTVLALVALLALICGIAVLWIRTGEVFGAGVMPWDLELKASLDTLRAIMQA